MTCQNIHCKYYLKEKVKSIIKYEKTAQAPPTLQMPPLVRKNNLL